MLQQERQIFDSLVTCHTSMSLGLFLHAVQPLWAVQVSVNGILYGAWGRENYGTKPIKVDALEVCVSSSVNFDFPSKRMSLLGQGCGSHLKGRLCFVLSMPSILNPRAADLGLLFTDPHGAVRWCMVQMSLKWHLALSCCDAASNQVAVCSSGRQD